METLAGLDIAPDEGFAISAQHPAHRFRGSPHPHLAEAEGTALDETDPQKPELTQRRTRDCP
jgi:hypothetical protein